MKITNVNLEELIFALDIGTRSIIGTVGIISEKKFQVIAESYIEHEERAMIDGQIHDIQLVASGVLKVKKELEDNLNVKLTKVAIAAAGRFLRTTQVKSEIEVDIDKEIDRETIRSLELTAVRMADEEVAKSSQGKLYCVGYSVKNYYLNGYVITNLKSHKGEKIAVEIIATFLPRSVVDSLYAVMDKASLEVVSLTLEPIAAMEAAVPQNLRLLNLALVDIGAGTSDIAISSKESISAYGMVPMAGDEVTEIISQAYLVDFNTAEKIKKECSGKDKIQYIDVLGFENILEPEEVLKIINPIVVKISEEIGNRIIELNGGKAPNAVFLVGGGAHTPFIKENIVKILNLPINRVVIKGRESVTDCICDSNLGSTGVTVLGIALVSIKRLGNDFVDVTINDKIISLFNAHKHTVMDVMMQEGINPKILIGKNGRNIRFIVDGIKRVAFGSLAKSAEIKINNLLSNIDSEVAEGDIIDISFSVDGKSAEPKIMDYVKSIQTVSFYFEDEIRNIEPVAFINGIRTIINGVIREDDDVSIVIPTTISEYAKYFGDDTCGLDFMIDNKKLLSDYVIKEGDRIYKVAEITKEIKVEKIVNKNEQKETQNLNIKVNKNMISLKGKDKYIFVDIFNYVDFDLTISKGNLILKLNGSKAEYYQPLNNGDVIEIYWEDIISTDETKLKIG
ncbi:cell division protein FtsA [Clostridium estertheticum]|uniref:Cell division protein FtsA n=1 Tax=Clostridium estertheticum subsp. estertheticum TaxID=1552 RepID=A0A1J0GJ89_9CLOT|nr:cell division FtsA domain-containing protein [Clostridium estertheticum]APC41428.1 cell division protein FtsA [Clostridium estertheticum subsp. estertheticum]MBU3072888.1 rod shape-determining protein [Clostridium estertheticum]MBU3163075.1 rod shape-determining protein [Clostridium estertheticum]MBZ9616674.1 rod shape-determining protein [Clostridium estertheticum subsp. laramiense]MCB2341651.1 rod shape-determining protein [Clostridium estertheticum]